MLRCIIVQSRAKTYTVGTAISPLALPRAFGGNGALRYTLTPAVPGLIFDRATRQLNGTPTQAGAYEMTYRAVDADANTQDSDTATRTFTLTVEAAPSGGTDPSDTAPRLDDTVSAPTYTAGTAISPLTLPAATGGDGTLSYTLTPAVPGLTFDPATRQLSGTPTQAGTYEMTYRVSDADANTQDSDSDSLAFTLTVEAAPSGGTDPSDAAPRLDDTVSAPTYTAGTAISPLTLPAATGGDGTLSYTLTPAVPGLTFDPATRRLSGTPTQAGTYEMTYRVSDADANTQDSDSDSLTFAITVQAAGDFAPRMYSTVASQTYTADTAIFRLTLPRAFNGNGALRYTLTPAVPGLTFDPATRRLSGTPTQAGTYEMTYRAADADANTQDSDTATRTFTLTVQAAGDFAPRMYGTVASQTYTVGTAISPLALPRAFGGNGALSYTLTPAVPGLIFDRATRQLNGTPSQAGAYEMTYRAGDADANTQDSDTATRTFTLAVEAAPSGGTDPSVPADDHGDMRSDATELVLGSSVAGRIETDGDEDFFAVEVTGPGTLTVYTTGNLDTVGELQGGDGTRLAVDDDGGSQDNFSIERDVGASTYFVKVGSVGSSVGSYVVHARLVAEPTLPPDHSDMLEGATEVGVGQSVTGYMGSTDDVDYFLLEVSEPGVLRIRLESEIPGLEISLRDENGDVVAAERTESPAVIIAPVQAAVYRIVVSCSVNPICVAAVDEAISAGLVSEPGNALDMVKFTLAVEKLVVEEELELRPDAPFVGACRCVAIVEPEGESQEIDFADFIRTPSGNRPIIELLDQDQMLSDIEVIMDRESGRARISAPRGADLGIYGFTVRVSDSYIDEGSVVPLPGKNYFTMKVNVSAVPRKLVETDLEIMAEPGRKGTLILGDVIGPPENVGGHPPIQFALDVDSPEDEDEVARLSATIESPVNTLVIEPPLDLRGEFSLRVSAWFPDAERSEQFTIRVIVGFRPRPVVGAPGLNFSLTPGETVRFQLTEYVEDPAGGPLTFSLDPLPPGFTADLDGSDLTVGVSSDVEPDDYMVKVTATNSIGISWYFYLLLVVDLGPEWIRAWNVNCHVHHSSYWNVVGRPPSESSVPPFSYSGECWNRRAHVRGTMEVVTVGSDGKRNVSTWEGAWIDGFASGQGTLIRTIDGTVALRSQGVFFSGILHGEGTLTVYDGDGGVVTVYEGEFDYGGLPDGTVTHYDGNGNVESRYEGELVDLRGHGQGTWSSYDLDGNVVERLEGEFVDGHLPWGTLTRYDENGNVAFRYEGELVEFSGFGQGTLTFYTDGRAWYSWEGDLGNGFLNGRGIRTRYDADGNVTSRTEGEFVESEIARGTLTKYREDGNVSSRYEGDFSPRDQGDGIDGRPHGQGTRTGYDESGNVSHREEGGFFNGLLHGQGTSTHYGDSGSLSRVYEGEFVGGSLHGQGKSTRYDDSGSVSRVDEGEFVGGRRHGQGIETYYDGHGNVSARFEGEYVDNQKHGRGTWTNYYESGSVSSRSEEVFDRGRLHGQVTRTRYYESGGISSRWEGEHVDDGLHGQLTSIEYYENGQVSRRFRGEYVNDSLHTGTSTTYDREGNVTRVCTTINGNTHCREHQ